MKKKSVSKETKIWSFFQGSKIFHIFFQFTHSKINSIKNVKYQTTEKLRALYKKNSAGRKKRFNERKNFLILPRKQNFQHIFPLYKL